MRRASDQSFVIGILSEDGDVLEETSNLEAIAEDTLRRCSQNDRLLRALDLSATLLTSRFLVDFAQSLQHNSMLREVYLDACGVDDEGARVLAQGMAARKQHVLQILSLECNQIRCRGASHLARILTGRGSRFSRTGRGSPAPSFGPGKGLKYLSLKGNCISAIGAKALTDALSTTDDSLELLNVECNQIDDWAAGWFAVLIRSNPLLRCLALHQNPIGPSGVLELTEACREVSASLVVLHLPFEERGVDVEATVEVITMGQRLFTIYVSEPNLFTAFGRTLSTPSHAELERQIPKTRGTSEGQIYPAAFFLRIANDATHPAMPLGHDSNQPISGSPARGLRKANNARHPTAAERKDDAMSNGHRSTKIDLDSQRWRRKQRVDSLTTTCKGAPQHSPDSTVLQGENSRPVRPKSAPLRGRRTSASLQTTGR